MAGKGPDIICMPRTEQYRKYADLGLLEDLYSYLDKDADTGREDYLSNICQAYERNGALYGISPYFSISTIAAPTKYVGEKMGISLEEFQEMLSNLPEDAILNPLFQEKRMVFSMLLPMTYSQFIDYETYTCHFDSEEFISWLQVLNEMKLVTDMTEALEKEYVLGIRYVSDVGDYQAEQIQLQTEEVTYLGYPGAQGNGSYLFMTEAVAISSQGKNKDGAWEFIKFLLAEEQQDLLLEQEQPQFPVRTTSLEKNFAKAMETEYETDESGQQEECPKGNVTLPTGETIPYYTATEQDIEKMRQLVTSVVSMDERASGEPIIQILEEEVAAFYEGDKSAKEVADLIQNRVQTYLSEIRK